MICDNCELEVNQFPCGCGWQPPRSVAPSTPKPATPKGPYGQFEEIREEFERRKKAAGEALLADWKARGILDDARCPAKRILDGMTPVSHEIHAITEKLSPPIT